MGEQFPSGQLLGQGEKEEDRVNQLWEHPSGGPWVYSVSGRGKKPNHKGHAYRVSGISGNLKWG